jgi:hypothetical protein
MTKNAANGMIRVKEYRNSPVGDDWASIPLAPTDLSHPHRIELHRKNASEAHFSLYGLSKAIFLPVRQASGMVLTFSEIAWGGGIGTAH